MAKKYKLKIIYGKEACDYYDGHTLLGTIRKIKSGDVYGDYGEYEFDTEEDAKLVCKILCDADGWDTNWAIIRKEK